MSTTELKHKTCFVISPIGEEASEERKRSDQVLCYVIKEALEPKGYVVTRADEIAKPGSITTQVIESIWRSDVVVADLTDHNPNVFYELAVRHAVGKPIVHMISATQRIPFDIADFRTIHFELSLDGAARARKELCAQVDELETGAKCVTPISLAGVMIELGKSSSEDKIVLRQLLEGFGEIRSESREQFKELTSRMYQLESITAMERELRLRRDVLRHKVGHGVRREDLMASQNEAPKLQTKPGDALRAILARKQAIEEARAAEKAPAPKPAEQ